jgi:hypothetical protein
MILNSLTLSSDSAAANLGALVLTTAGHMRGYVLSDARLDPAPTRLRTESYPLAQGGMVSPSPLGIRELSVSGVIVAPTANDSNELRRQLVAACSGLVSIQYDNGEELVTLNGYLDGSVGFQLDGGFHQKFNLRIQCSDPVGYGAASTAALATAPGVIANNSGDADVWPTILATVTSGTVTTFKVRNATTGLIVELEGLSATAGTTITIDMNRGYEVVELGGASAFDRMSAGSRFWPLSPGANTVVITSTGGSVSGTLTWRAGWAS